MTLRRWNPDRESRESRAGKAQGDRGAGWTCRTLVFAVPGLPLATRVAWTAILPVPNLYVEPVAWGGAERHRDHALLRSTATKMFGKTGVVGLAFHSVYFRAMKGRA